MDVSFSDLKKKDVIDVKTGKKLGKTGDILFSFPEGKVVSFTVSGGFLGCGESKTFKFCDIEKIGEDAVLINEKKQHEQGGRPPVPGKPCDGFEPPRPCREEFCFEDEEAE